MGKKIQKKATRGRPRKQVKPNTKLYRQYKKRKVNKKDKTLKIKVTYIQINYIFNHF